MVVRRRRALDFFNTDNHFLNFKPLCSFAHLASFSYFLHSTSLVTFGRLLAKKKEFIGWGTEYRRFPSVRSREIETETLLLAPNSHPRVANFACVISLGEAGERKAGEPRTKRPPGLQGLRRRRANAFARKTGQWSPCRQLCASITRHVRWC